MTGTVELLFGSGLAGTFGRRLASKVGLPQRPGTHPLTVVISHRNGQLHWSRQFSGGRPMVSVFTPHGCYPDGVWQEDTGSVSLVLGVEIDNGGWYWRQRKVMLKGLPMPAWLVPQSLAYKRVTAGGYEFVVAFCLPIIGEIVSYRGLLWPEAKRVSPAAPTQGP